MVMAVVAGFGGAGLATLTSERTTTGTGMAGGFSTIGVGLAIDGLARLTMLVVGLGAAETRRSRLIGGVAATGAVLGASGGLGFGDTGGTGCTSGAGCDSERTIGATGADTGFGTGRRWIAADWLRLTS